MLLLQSRLESNPSVSWCADDVCPFAGERRFARSRACLKKQTINRLVCNFQEKVET
jgi:hypothetical protein